MTKMSRHVGTARGAPSKQTKKFAGAYSITATPIAAMIVATGSMG